MDDGGFARRETARDPDPYVGTFECVRCGADVRDEETPVCCSYATHDDGSHDDPVCVNCCDPPRPFNPQIEYFPM